MKRFVRTFVLMMIVMVGVAGVVHAGVFDPKRHSICYNEEGKYDPQSKDCDPHSCGCLFHEIGRFVIGIFE